LVQAQERSAGAVIYTGMNSRGDTFNGNTKVSASSGQTTSYDIPKPTITGQDPSKLSVAFDEITVRERILVEGGTSGFVLSQFDGPVTLTKSLRVKRKSYFGGQLRVTFKDKAINENTGSIISKGGIGVGDDSYFRAKVEILGQIKTGTGLVPDEDLGAYIGDTNNAYSEAHVGNIKIGATTDNTIDTRSGGLTINATSGSLIQTASADISQTASAGISQTATTGKVTIVASVNDVEINAGTGKSIALKKSTYITGDLEVRGAESVPPGVNSGTIRANYLEIPNITPVGGIVIWSGDETQLPAVTVNGSVVTMWSICDGRAISRTTYSQLFNLIGSKFGSGNGSTTFNLPDLRNRFIIGSSGDLGSNIETDESDVPLSPKRTGGQKDLELVTHNHPMEGAGAHDHSPYAVISVTAPHNHPHSHPHSHPGSTSPVAAHKHPFSLTGGSHSHANISEVGFDNKGNSNTYRFTANDGASFPYTDPDKEINTSQVRQMTSGSDHTHTGETLDGGGHSHPFTTSGDNTTNDAGGSAPHDHPMTLSPLANHIHPIGNTGTTTGKNKNLPPYYALYYIMRIL
jgi:microcystin-dependent protein